MRQWLANLIERYQKWNRRHEVYSLQRQLNSSNVTLFHNTNAAMLERVIYDNNLAFNEDGSENNGTQELEG